MKPLLWIIAFLLFGCQNKPQDTLQYLNGYWEISQVEKNGQILKSFKINPDIDYFKIHDTESGYRKKLKPLFDGRFETSRDTLKFRIETHDNRLYLEYHNDLLTLREQVVKATSNELIISNSAGYIYTYKPYKPLNLEE